ncbi:MAG: protein jag [Janthinobacterium lividum]
MNDTTDVVSQSTDEITTSGPGDLAAVNSDGAAPTRTRGSGGSRLEEEGDIAADYLEELLDITDLDGDIDIDIENGRASIAIVTNEAGTAALRRLVGSDGVVLDALQELTRLAVQAQTGDRTRLLLDVAGHRATKRTALVTLAAEVCTRVQETGQDERLEPMPAFERKVIHDAVATLGFTSESEGEEPRRCVVVLASTPDVGTSDNPAADDAESVKGAAD